MNCIKLYESMINMRILERDINLLELACFDMQNIMILSPYFLITEYRVRVRVMVFNTSFNTISVIKWWSVLLVEDTRVPRENHHCKSLTNFIT